MTEVAGKPAEGSEDSAAGLLGVLVKALWFPAFFVVGFLLCYVLPFHAPSPHHIQVAVADRAAAAELSAGLAKSAPGAFDILPAADATEARRMVSRGEAVAAFAVGSSGTDTLYVAQASGSALESVVTAALTPAAAAQGHTLATVDLVPTASGDKSGTGLFYIAMIWNIVPYITVMMLLSAVQLSRRAKVLTLAGVGTVLSLVAYYVALSLNIVPNEPLALLYAFLMTQAISWTVFGLVPFVKQYLPAVAVGLAVLLSIPSSGGALPYQLVPQPFRLLHPVMPLGNLVDALRSVFYFHNAGLLRPTLVLSAWWIVGAALIAVGALQQRRREHAQPDSAAPVAQPPVQDRVIQTVKPHAVTPGARDQYGTRATMVGGVVHEPDGTPVPDALVTMLAPGGRQLLRTVTDRDGAYAATALPEEFVTIVLLAQGYAPAATRALPRQGHRLRQDFVAQPAIAPDHTAERAT